MPEAHAVRPAGLARTLLQVGASLALLAATLWFVNVAEVARRLRLIDIRWMVLTLTILVAQFALLAARWWLFARWLRAPLAYRRALPEYFLATLLNQILPLGVLGDVGRALRHTRTQPTTGTAPVVLAIVLERVSGQIALWLVVLAVLPGWWRLLRAHLRWPALLVPATLTALTLLALVAWLTWRRLKRNESLRRLGADAVRALCGPAHAALHLPLSFALLASHVLAFVAIARGLGLHLPLGLAFAVVPLVLVATTLPTFAAGWGVREAMLAGLYHLAGLHAADGVSLGLVYGSLSLLASTPGILACLTKGTISIPPK